ncbi:MAG: radical SAM family heme chaperone HemW [Dehalococcoidales bacterium]|nr:radical SAM family heme chaperone HemW [Dehalococcoidales bacterium]
MRGLYIHIPFCVRKCLYCDFYSLPGRANDREAYVEAVLAESAAFAGMSFQSLYFGGGTPSILGSELLEKLGNGLRKALNLTGIDEATVEINPDSASPEFLTTAKMIGINRVSIGVQSIDDNELQAVGRVHTASQALAAVNLAKELGFKSVSADLIVGLPGQSWPSLHHSLYILAGTGIQHISLYCLSVEPGTPLANDPPENLPDEDVQAELFGRAVSFLEERHFVHYEISNFALAGHECRHNLNYWRGGEYLGLGPASASHLGGKRFRNRSDLGTYLENPCGMAEDVEELDAKAKASEEAMLRLRLLSEGIDINEMAARFGQDNIAPLIERLEGMVINGELVAAGSRFRLPPSRVLTSNPIFAEVLE